MSIPSPDDQLAFLSKIQRVFSEGDFTATYKCALLLALCDLSVECGDDSGAELSIGLEQIADKFIEYYWNQTLPFGKNESGVLIQNNGKQAAVVSEILNFKEAHSGVTLSQASKEMTYPELNSAVKHTVREQPVRYLQNLGGTTETFLFDPPLRGVLTLKSGVVFCFRQFYSLISEMARSRWVTQIKSIRGNRPFLGDDLGLEEFLFDSSRQSLTEVGKQLREMDDCQCFYCGEKSFNVEVDHFIPHSLYVKDNTHNFVLADPKCNRSKSDTLAARIHLERWVERVNDHQALLSSIGLHCGIETNPSLIKSVAYWAYSTARKSGANAWIKSKHFELIDAHYDQVVGQLIVPI